MEKINAIQKRVIIFLVFSILLVSFVNASYGVSSPYWKGHPLQIAPGDTREVSITLQNMDEEDIKVEVSLKKGSEIASVTEKEYLVKAGTIDTEILVTINIPEDVSFNTLYEVTLSSREVISFSDTGGVALGIAMDTTFDVLVADVSKSEPEKTYAWIIILVIAIVVIIILFLALSKKPKRSK